MKVELQKIIVIAVTLLSLALIVKNQYSDAMVLAVGLVGFISQTTLNDKQSQKIDEYVEKQYNEKEEKQ